MPGRRGRRIVTPAPLGPAEGRVIFYPVRVVSAPLHGLAEQLGALLERLARTHEAQQFTSLKPARRLLAQLLSQLGGGRQLV